MTSINRTGAPRAPRAAPKTERTRAPGSSPGARSTARANATANYYRDGFDPQDVFERQHWKIPRNRHALPEAYPEQAREKLFRDLDTKGVAYPPLEDEAHVNRKIRTTYASVDRKAGVIVVGLDNAAYHSKGYEGLSRGERRFAEDMAEYGKSHGLTTVFLDHIPPTQPSKFKLPNPQERSQTIEWMNELRANYPNSLWVHGHAHPDKTRMLDLNGARGGREVGNIVLSGQSKGSITRITTYPNGRRIEEFKLAGDREHPRLHRVQNVVTSLSGVRVDPREHRLGKPMGVLYGISDIHRSNTLKPYFKALAQDAKRMDKAGLSVSYLDAGDHTVKRGKIPVSLPEQGRYFWAPGNHDYYNQRTLGNVVASFARRLLGMRIDYTQ